MRRAVVLLLVVIGAAACAARPPSNRSSLGKAHLSPVPSVARVVCEESRTLLLTPTVRLHPHGVDFSIQNVTDHTLAFLPGDSDDRAGTQSEFVGPGDNSVPPGVKEMRWLVPPGHTKIACIPRPPLPGDRLQAREAAIHIVDPDRVYVPIPSKLDCEQGSDRRNELILPLSTDDPQEPTRLTRETLEGLQPDDVVARTGYSEDDSPQVKIVRVGRVVGLVSMESTFGKGLLWTCVSSGIRRSDSSPPERPRMLSPIPTESFPPQSPLVEGKSYWVLYLAIARKGSPELEDAIGRARQYGYRSQIRELGCDEGAAEAYGLPMDLVGVALYFDRERDPWFVADAINAPHYGAPIRVIVYCVD